MKLDRGDIINVDLEPVKGSETGKVRPCVVISNNIQNKTSPVIIIAIITAWNEKKDSFPFCVTLDIDIYPGIRKKSVIDCAQIRTISKKRIIGNSLGKLTGQDIDELDKSLRLSLDL